MKLRSLSIATFCTALGITSIYAADEAASDYWVRGMPAAWLVNFDGKTNYSTNNVGSGDSQLSDLGLANQELGFGLEAGAKLPILVSVHIGGFIQETDGAFAGKNFNYGGQNFTSGSSSARISDLYIEADLRPLDLDLVGCAIGIAYHAMNNEVTVSGGGNSVSLSEDFHFPAIAVRAHANLPALISLGAELKVHWMEISYLDNKISYLDASAQITYMPWELVGFMGGYRLLSSNINFKSPTGVNASAKLDLSLGGPFLGVIAKF